MLKDNQIWLVGYEAKPSIHDGDCPTDDFGIECVCDSEESAMEQIANRSKQFKSYKFFIWGNYPLLSLGEE